MRVAMMLPAAVLALSACGRTVVTAVPAGTPAPVATERDQRDRADTPDSNARADREREERARAEKERAEKERADKARADKARADKERADKVRADKERADKERADKERADKERADKVRADKERADKVRADKERADKERADRERAERERADRERAEKARGPRALEDVPPGQHPKSGECRLWYSGRTPGQQPKAAACNTLVGNVPQGAFILYGGKAWDSQFDWVAQEQRERGSVPAVIVEIVRSMR